MAIGHEFQPSEDKRLRQGLNKPAGGQLGPAAQQAIKILSLRIPNVLGGRPPAPADLLRPQMGGNAGPGAASSVMQSSGLMGPSPSAAPSAPSLSTPSMASPTAMPFSMSGMGGGSQGNALSSLVSQSLSGGSSTPSFEFGEEKKVQGSAPVSAAPGGGSLTPAPGAAPSMSITPTPSAPSNSLSELLDWLSRGGNVASDAGSFGNEG
jgi:hypothetical protein